MHFTKETMMLAIQTAIGLRMLRIEDIAEDVLELHDEVARLKESILKLSGEVTISMAARGKLFAENKRLQDVATGEADRAHTNLRGGR